MKKFLTAIFAVLTGVFLAGYDASAEAPLCGGVTDRTDRTAPKVDDMDVHEQPVVTDAPEPTDAEDIILDEGQKQTIGGG